MSPDQHNKVLAYRCPCGADTVRKIVLTPSQARPFARCVCGAVIDWSAVPVEDHTLYVAELLQRIKRGDFL